MATATLPLMFRVTKGYFTLHRPLHRSNRESEGFHALPLTFRVTKGYSTHHSTLPLTFPVMKGFHGNDNPSTRILGDEGVIPPTTDPSLARIVSRWVFMPFHSRFE